MLLGRHDWCADSGRRPSLARPARRRRRRAGGVYVSVCKEYLYSVGPRKLGGHGVMLLRSAVVQKKKICFPVLYGSTACLDMSKAHLLSEVSFGWRLAAAQREACSNGGRALAC